MKRLISAFAVLAIVGAALAFNRPFGDGSVYCSRDTNLVCQSKTDYRIDPNGATTTPCGTGVQPYVLTSDNNCVATGSGTHFTTTSLGK
jgi:hypothetical protein